MAVYFWPQHLFNSYKNLYKILLFLAEASTVVTTDQAVRGGRLIDLKQTVNSAVEKCSCVKRVFMSRRTGADVPMTEKDILLEQVSNRS